MRSFGRSSETMRFCLVAVALSVLAGCGSPPDENKIGKLEFYDWLEFQRGLYADAIDGGREAANTRAQLEQSIKFQVDRRYDSIVERAASEEDPKKRELAVCALGFSQRPEAVIHIESHLSDPLPHVRGTAAAAIGILRPPKAPFEKIEPLLTDQDAYCRQGALFAIKLLGDGPRKPSKEGMARIEKIAVEDSDFSVRNEAVLALGRIKDPNTVDTLRKCLTDESVYVRSNAAMVLAGFGPLARTAVPALIERLKDGETGVVERAHFALKAITGRVDADPQYGSWQDWMNEISKVLEFVCPNHPEIKSESPGSCSKCGVTLEAHAKPEAEFACPEHTDVVSRKPGTCFKCQKELRPRKKEDPKPDDQK